MYRYHMLSAAKLTAAVKFLVERLDLRRPVMERGMDLNQNHIVAVSKIIGAMGCIYRMNGSISQV